MYMCICTYEVLEGVLPLLDLRVGHLRGREDTVDRDSVGSNRSIETRLSDFDKRLSSKSSRIDKFELDEGLRPYVVPPSEISLL